MRMLALLLMVAVAPAVAFEVETHAAITKVAVDRSVLADTEPDSVLGALGLDRVNPFFPFRPWWTAYSEELYLRSGEVPLANDPDDLVPPEPLDECTVAKFNVANSAFADVSSLGQASSVARWIVRGAIREDDLGSIGSWLSESNCVFGDWTDTGTQIRVFNHFYDPTNGDDLWPCPTGTGCSPAVDWALGTRNAHNGDTNLNYERHNGYSYADARQAYWWSLTHRSDADAIDRNAEIRADDAEHRFFLLATLFRALGNVVHLVQDMAQPQHTRNDRHDPLSSDFQQSLEAFTNARVLGGIARSSHTNAHLRSFTDEYPSALASSPPRGDDYPVASFAEARSYFRHTSGTASATGAGLAEFSNRNFFTPGTLPGSTEYQSPPQNFSFNDGYRAMLRPCTALAGMAVPPTITCKHWVREITDVVADYPEHLPEGFTKLTAPVLSEALFARFIDDTDQINQTLETTLGPTEFLTMANVGMPRAVGYSAGLINFFFRGRLEVKTPENGVVAIVDHGIEHVLEEGLPFANNPRRIYGFEKIRLHVQNDTLSTSGGILTESGTGAQVPQRMDGPGLGPSQGELVAIARYHRNECYRPDLHGELVYREVPAGGTREFFVPSGCNLAEKRTKPVEISVSSPVQIGSGGSVTPVIASGCANINGSLFGDCQDGAPLIEFDFSADPIPINATDLFIQVAYRGQLGRENDAIAIGRVDVSEATFVTMANSGDYYLYEDEWEQSDQLPEDIRPETDMDWAQYCIEGRRVARLRDGDRVPARGLMRFALLMDDSVHAYSYRGRFLGDADLLGMLNSHMISAVKQSDKEYMTNAPYIVDPMEWFRSTPMGMKFVSNYWWDMESEFRPEHYFQLSAGPAFEGRNNGPYPYPIEVSFPGPDSPGCY